jgi:hypothetical protein
LSSKLKLLNKYKKTHNIMNLLLVLLFACAMLTVGILIGIITQQRGAGEYRGEIINTICDDIIELQAMHAPVEQEINWDEFRAQIDARVNEVAAIAVAKALKEEKKIQPLVIESAPSFIEEEFHPLIKLESIFRGYANCDNKINSLEPTMTRDGKYYIKADGAWAMYLEDGYFKAQCEGNFKRYPQVFFDNRQEMLKVYQLILTHAQKEGRLKRSDVA